MGIQQEKDAYLGELLERDAITQDEYNDIIFRPSVNAFDSNYLSARFIDNINWGWSSWQAAKAQAVPEGFVLLSRDNFESLNEFKDLYKRAIINARKRKHQLNWAHVAGLGVGSGRAVKLCKMFGIDPCATNMYEVVEAQELNHD